jgi:hypothetical protein
MRQACASLRTSISASLGDAVADRLFGEIQALVARTLLAVHRVITQDRHCFELYGCAGAACSLAPKAAEAGRMHAWSMLSWDSYTRILHSHCDL